MNYELRIILAVIAILFGVFGAQGQQRTVIAGLGGNTEYRNLIKEERGLVKTADSLATEIANLRRLLRADTLGRAANSAAIVRMEEQGFEIRSRMARLASRINTIEQEWILQSLAEGPVADTTVQNGAELPEEAPPGYHTRNLVYSSYFTGALSYEQLAELHDAQRAEGELPPLVEQYRARHETIAALARDYKLAATQGEADSISADFDRQTMANRRLAGLVGEVWESVFDSKSYIYNLMADEQNRHDLLDRFTQGLERVREELSRHSEAPAAIADYVLQKRMLTDYEIALAKDMDNRLALDSLRLAATRIPEPESLATLAPVVLKERLFLDYSDITIGGSPYNSSNPIPEVAVWPKGVIWRVRIGNFAARQSPSVFRGAHPIAVETGDDRRFRYFAGGFPTDSLAAAAIEQLRRAGFRAPVAVVWMDGVYIDPADTGEGTYRIDIRGVGELSREIREAIDAATTGSDGSGSTAGESTDEAPHSAKAEIVRAGEAFIVTPLDRTEAVRLRTGLEAFKASYPDMEVRLSKNPE